MAIRTRITIFNAALLRTGNDEVSDGDGSALWRALDANYDEIVREAFEMGDGVFPFGKVRQTLTSRSASTLGYTDAYALPDNLIHIVEVYLSTYSASDLLEPWEVDADGALNVNAGTRTVEIEAIKVGLEHTWSAAFAKGIQRKLEGVIKDASEEFNEAMEKDAAGNQQIGLASVKASKNRSQRRAWKAGGGRLMRRRRTRDT